MHESNYHKQLMTIQRGNAMFLKMSCQRNAGDYLQVSFTDKQYGDVHQKQVKIDRKKEEKP